METELIFERIQNIVVDEIGLSPEEITMESSFSNDLGVDSLLLAELIMRIEDDFKIIIPDGDAEKIVTVQDAVSYISSVMD